jgi:hypothetical protein
VCSSDLKGNSTVAVQEAVRAAQSEAQAALSHDQVPRAYQGAEPQDIRVRLAVSARTQDDADQAARDFLDRVLRRRKADSDEAGEWVWHTLNAHPSEHAAVASYAVPMAYRIRFCLQMNAREAMHLLELRTSPQGHPSYRRVCQAMHRLIAEQAGHRALAAAMRFVNHEAVALERLQAETRAARAQGSDG